MLWVSPGPWGSMAAAAAAAAAAVGEADAAQAAGAARRTGAAAGAAAPAGQTGRGHGREQVEQRDQEDGTEPRGIAGHQRTPSGHAACGSGPALWPLQQVRRASGMHHKHVPSSRLVKISVSGILASAQPCCSPCPTVADLRSPSFTSSPGPAPGMPALAHPWGWRRAGVSGPRAGCRTAAAALAGGAGRGGGPGAQDAHALAAATAAAAVPPAAGGGTAAAGAGAVGDGAVRECGSKSGDTAGAGAGGQGCGGTGRCYGGGAACGRGIGPQGGGLAAGKQSVRRAPLKCYVNACAELCCHRPGCTL